MLTFELKSGYAKGLKTYIHGFRTRQICDFFVYPLGWLRAENNQYQPELLYVAFSEATHLAQFAWDILKRTYKMTNTIINTTESTLQSLYRYYSEMAKTWYKGDYNLFYLGGYGIRKKHRECVDAVRQAADMFPVIYADTRHLNAVICLKKAGFEWVDRKKKLLRRLQK